MAPEPKRFVRFADSGHNELDFAIGLKARAEFCRD